MATGNRHRARALLSSLLDGVVVGGSRAALDHPRRSPARRRTYALVGGAVLADAALGEYPTVRDIAAGRPPRPVDPEEQRIAVTAGLVSVSWGLLASVVDGPLTRRLAARGVVRPHRSLGLAFGALAAVTTLPLWWRRATLRAAHDVRAATETADLAAWEAELAGVDR